VTCELCDGIAKWEHQGKRYCEKCIERVTLRTEVWSRIVGYLRPVRKWADHKKLEFKQRKLYDIPTTDQLRDLDPALLSGVPRGAGPGQ